jgi:hypothetical protein
MNGPAASKKWSVLLLRIVTLILTLGSWSIDPGVGSAAESGNAPPTVLGHSGGVLVSNADVLSPWKTRFGMSGLYSSGGSGNRLDLLASSQPDSRVLNVRGFLAMGFPAGIEAAVTVPYVNVRVDGDSTEGSGDLVLSAKWKAAEQRGWIPATALSISWITETASEPMLSTVSTNGYLATVSSQLTLVNAADRPWSMVGEVGGFWRDPGRPEAGSALVYGVGVIVPLVATGLYAETGELQVVAEVAGTNALEDQATQPDDSLSLVWGFRYLTEHWGITATGVSTTYEAESKKNGIGGLVGLSATF